MNSGENHSLRRRVLLAAVAFAALLPAACGKRGPLYLPDQAGAQAKAGGQTVKPAPSGPDNASGNDSHQK